MLNTQKPGKEMDISIVQSLTGIVKTLGVYQKDMETNYKRIQ